MLTIPKIADKQTWQDMRMAIKSVADPSLWLLCGCYAAGLWQLTNVLRLEILKTPCLHKLGSAVSACVEKNNRPEGDEGGRRSELLSILL